MIPNWIVILAALAYMGILFSIASFADKRAKQGRSIIANPYIYALSLAIYCTAWTFYGSVGRASQTGISFLTIYLGPTLFAPLWLIILRKIIRICKAYRITSIADFIASRYGKQVGLGALVTIIAVLGGIPYIALQLKAISSSYAVMSGGLVGNKFVSQWMAQGTSLYLMFILLIFAILFGTRQLDPLERHEGIVAAIAFESIIKLVTFLAAGIYVTYGMYQGFGNLFEQAASKPELSRLFTIQNAQEYGDWFWLTTLSSLAFLMLPRQFHVSVVENVDEKHVAKAIWMVPLYLLVINIFVLPIAFGGRLYFGDTIDADMYVLALPIVTGQKFLALSVFIGGFSAATSMVVVATMALSTMVCNDLVIPILLRIRSLKFNQESRLMGWVLTIRRISIVVIMCLGYIYFLIIGSKYTLVSIGLISFAAVSQFAPALLGGLFWKRATYKGALTGLLVGFVVWMFTLPIPSMAEAGFFSTDFIKYGFFGISWLKPYQLFGLSSMNVIPHSLFWSWLLNIGCYVGISLFTKQSVLEYSQSIAFVDIFKQGEARTQQLWKREASFDDLQSLLLRFMGTSRTESILAPFQDKINQDNLVQVVERQLAGVIGSASARVMVSRVVKEQPLDIQEVLSILDETSQVMRYNKRLEAKSQQLEQATRELRVVNERMTVLDQLKDDFVATITHELRTPLTSVRALTEILRENPELPIAKRQEFLDIMLQESERLSRLINQVLDLEKTESGKMEWEFSTMNLENMIHDAIRRVQPLIKERNIHLEANWSLSVPIVEADYDRLLQVMVNLLSNAIKFCKPEQGVIEIHLLRKGEILRVEVKDNGKGIAPQDQQAVFEKFRQITDAKLGKPSGTGLGLPISKQIIEAHHGKIGVKSKVGKGSTFFFELPEKKSTTSAQGSPRKSRFISIKSV